MSRQDLHYEYLLQLEDFFTSGQFADEFYCAPEERRYELLDFAEKLMDISELADKAVSKIIFRKTD